MTRIYGWDQSHYDGTITQAIMARAKTEGIAFVTHKLGEGLSTGDDKAAGALAAAKAAGLQVIGGYWFIHDTDSPSAEVTAMIRQADKVAPWWREFPGWFWQCDAENSPTGTPSPSYVQRWCDEAVAQTGRTVICYASHGMYGNRLAGLGHPLWNANYATNPAGAFTAIYPGDTSPGWQPYSGQTPVILQYGSRATIAGITTCDANAFRGTIDDLLTLIGADMTVTEASIWAQPLAPRGETASGNLVETHDRVAEIYTSTLPNITTSLAAITKTEAAIQATLNAMAAGGTSIDTAALAAQITAVGNAESTAVATLQANVADLEARLAASAAAAAGALAAD